MTSSKPERSDVETAAALVIPDVTEQDFADPLPLRRPIRKIATEIAPTFEGEEDDGSAADSRDNMKEFEDVCSSIAQMVSEGHRVTLVSPKVMDQLLRDGVEYVINTRQ